MLYLLFALTFLAGILFYGMSPREDKLHLDTNQAEGMIVSFLNQHQAAKDYVYNWLGVGDNENESNVKRILNQSFLKAENSEDNVVFNFMGMTQLLTSDICVNNSNQLNQGRPGLDNDLENRACFVSQVVCTNNAGNIEESCLDGTDRYVVTYGGWENCDDTNCTRPSWWPSESIRVRRFERWRKAMANRTRGSISCGTLYRLRNNTWCIDNGETVFKNENVSPSNDFSCLNPVPTAVINALPYNDNQKDDLLLCYSKIKQGLGNYVLNPEVFYDGFSNMAIGKHTNAANAQWNSLASMDAINSVDWNNSENKPFYKLIGKLSTGIPLGETFTLTVLVDTPTGTGTIATLFGAGNADNASNDQIIFGKKANSGDDVFYVRKDLGPALVNPEYGESACNNVPDETHAHPVTKNRIISWTFVVGPCPDNGAQQCLNAVYENAQRHEPHYNNGAIVEEDSVPQSLTGPIPTVNNKYLFLASADLKIYGIRYYNQALTPQEVYQNFKVDQKRFGIADYSNGKLVSCTVVDKDEAGINGAVACECNEIDAGGE